MSRGDGPFAFISRRRWLKLSLGAGGALLGAGGGVWYWIRGSAPDVAGLRVLADHEHRTLSALCQVLFGAPDEDPILDVGPLDLPRAFDAFLAGEPAANVSDLRDAITLLEVGPIVDGAHARPFSRLAIAERRAFFEGWMTGDDLLRRMAALAFRKVFNLALYDHPAAWALIGYPGPAFGGA